jgi:excisionase family DNA binding protein
MEVRWLSADEIAVYLRVSRDTVYKWVVRKQLPGHKVGKLWRFQTEEVDDWIKAGSATDRVVEKENDEPHSKDGGA